MQEWIAAAQAELARIDGDHVNKKRNTIIALVDARLAGRSEETVWHLPTTCSRNTYHAKWKHDEIFVDVLVAVERLAREWMDTRALKAIQNAAEKLQLASPAAADRAIALMDSEDLDVAIKAAFGVLDRAGVETAPKQQQQVGLTPEVEAMIERVYGQVASPEIGEEGDG